MPTYEYECLKCGHEFELFQRITEPPRKRCPVCRGKVQRAIGAGAGLLFKGSGFYSTDYRSEGYHRAAKAEKSAAPSAPAGSGESSKAAAADKPATAKKKKP